MRWWSRVGSDAILMALTIGFAVSDYGGGGDYAAMYVMVVMMKVVEIASTVTMLVIMVVAW